MTAATSAECLKRTEVGSTCSERASSCCSSKVWNLIHGFFLPVKYVFPAVCSAGRLKTGGGKPDQHRERQAGAEGTAGTG